MSSLFSCEYQDVRIARLCLSDVWYYMEGAAGQALLG